MGLGIASPPGHGHHDDTAVIMDSHGPGRGGDFQVPRGVCGTQVPSTPQ